MTPYQQLCAHMEWADALMWKSVLASPLAPTSLDLRERIHHIHMVQHAYLQIWRKEPLRIAELATFDGLSAINTWARAFYGSARATIDAMSQEDLDGIVVFPWSEALVARFGTVHTATCAQTILQVASHSTYHRGQVAIQVRQLGGEPALTDLIVWIWLGMPAAEWPAIEAPAG